MPPFVILKRLLHLRNKAKTKYAREKEAAVYPILTHNLKEDNISNCQLTKRTSMLKVSRCRVCLKEGHKPIFDDYSSENIAEHIREHASIELTETDIFPKFICESCLALLHASVLFKTTAQDSDQKLRESTISSDGNLFPEMPTFEFTDQNEEYRDSDSSSEVSEDNQRVDEPDFFCKKCNMRFKNHKEFFSHRRSAEHKSSRVPCLECGVTVSRFYMSTHMLRRHSIERPYLCEVCGKRFPVLGAFKTHASVHTTALTFACSDCPYRGRYADSLRMHRRVHSGERPYACHQCPARFPNKSNLNKHARSHVTEFPFKCGECKKGFHTARELTEHQKVQHSGVREHLCNICGKEFGYRKAMMKHQMKVHHIAKRRRGRMPLYLQLEDKFAGQNTNQQHQGTDNT